MNRKFFARHSITLLAFAALLAQAALPTNAARAVASPSAAPDAQAGSVGVNGFFSVDPARQGSTFQAAIVLDIPEGLHVNSNRPLGKYAIPTVVKVEAPRGWRVTPVVYPAGKVRTFKFGADSPEERLAVYEGRATARFNVSVPADAQLDVAHVRVSVRFQSCNDEVCFPPATRELDLRIAVVGRDTPVNRVNGEYFGGGGRRKRG